MSFGIGIGDVMIILKPVWKAIELLRGEAVEGYREFENICRTLESVSSPLIENLTQIPGHDNIFRTESRRIKKLLKEFRGTVEELRSSLGRDRTGGPASWRHKITWRSYAARFERLQQGVFYQWTMIDWRQKNCQNTMWHDLFMRNTFLLEDPFGHSHRFDFVAIESWEGLHECLLATFPQGHRGHEIIQNHRYLLHRTDTFDEILCNSSGILPIKDVIKSREHVVMSAMFQKLEDDDIQCPKCCLARVANFQGPALECSRCSLWLRFHDSYDGQPDPLTQIAINDIKTSGKAGFVSRYLQLDGQAKDHSASIRKLIRKKAAQMGPIAPKQAKEKRPKIRHFRRVTLCNSQWPKFSGETASKRLVKTKQGLERAKTFYESEDFPIAMAAAVLNSTFWGGRESQAHLRFVTQILPALAHSVPPAVTPNNDARLLDEIVYQLQDGPFDFLTAKLEARCFLWMLWEVLQLETKILSSCANLLDAWSCPEDRKREKTPLFAKLFTLPHIALLVPWRLTVDVAGDIIEWACETKPIYLPTAIQHLIKRSRIATLHYYIHGDLSTYFQRLDNRESNQRLKNGKCLEWMEEAMRSEGKSINSERTKAQMESLIEGGQI